MKIILLLLLATLACHLSPAAAARVDIPGFSKSFYYCIITDK